jgi:hypothetical protein
VVAVLVLVTAVFVTVTQHRKSHKDPVAEYVKQINGVQQRLRYPLTQAEVAYKRFSASGKVDAPQRAQLASALRTLHEYERQVRALSAPADATELRARVLAYAVAQERAAAEAAELAQFMPKFVARIDELRASGAAFARDLGSGSAARSTKSAAERARQADALDAWLARAAVIRDRLRELRPPEVMRPTYDAQLVALAASRAAGRALSEALRTAAVDTFALNRRFAVATRSAVTTSRQQAQIAAIKAFNRRVTGVARLRDRVQNELQRLQRTRG